MKKNNFVSVCHKLVRKGDKFLNSHPNKFHEFASEILSKANLHGLYDYDEILKNSFQNNFKHEQNFKYSEFSDLPLTIARGEHCFIDIYFWRRNPTTIHNHHFTGAFQCLRGKNLDTKFKFKKVKKITPFHTLGELTEIRTKEVSAGSVEAIDLQDKFIHQNHHHGELTVNLCFRTPDYPKKNLANFLYSGLKFEKDQLGQARARRLYDFLQIDNLNPEKLNITLSDAFNFILSTDGMGSKHPRLLQLQKFMHKKIIQESGVDLVRLLQEHDKRLENIQSDYE